MYIAIGLGNPGEEYKYTRHNTGKMFVSYAEENLSEKTKRNIKFLHQDTFMNKTGDFVAKNIKNKKEISKLIVIYDDIDLPLGSLRVSYNRSSGGHKGLESIIRSLKTREFIRMRIGITPTTPKGKLKKPNTEGAVEKFILGDFKPAEKKNLEKVFVEAGNVLEILVQDGVHSAMNRFN